MSFKIVLCGVITNCQSLPLRMCEIASGATHKPPMPAA